LPGSVIKKALHRFHWGFLSARTGEWLFTVALNWVVYVQTESPLLLGAINACRLLPTLLVSLPAGHLADRFERRSLNTGSYLLNSILTLLVGLGLWFKLSFPLIGTMVVMRALATASEAPFRNAYLCSLLSGDPLKRAVAVNASVMNLGRIAGPILAGAMLSTAGSLATFALASVATAVHACVLQTLPAARVRQKRAAETTSRLPVLLETLRAEPQLRRLLGLALAVMFFGFPFTAMLPMITDSFLGLGSEQFGTLLAVSATGALLASSQLSLHPDSSSWKRTVTYAGLFGLSLLGLTCSNSFTSAATLLFGIGYFSQAYRTSSRMLFQSSIPVERAGSLLGLAFMDRGMIPLGGLAIGAAAEYLDTRVAVSLMGAGCLLTVAYFLSSPRRSPRQA
jgi:MFS family permease